MTTAPPRTPATKVPKTKSRHRWRRRFIWCVAIVLGVRLLLALAMPWLVNFGAGTIGCTASYRSASLSLLGLSLHLEDLEVRAANDQAAPVLLVAQEVTADLSTWQLLHGEIVVVDAALSGCTLDVVRNADGSLRLPAALLPRAPSLPEPAVGPPATNLASTHELPSFQLPLSIASARLHDLKIRCHDEGFTPARDFEAIVDLDVANVGRPEGPGHLTLRAQSPRLLDQLHLQATAIGTRDHLELQWQLTVRGVHLAELPLPPATLDPIAPAREASLDFAGSLAADRAPDSGSLAGLAGEIHGALQLDATERLRLRASVGPLQRDGEHFAAPLSAELHCPDLVDQLGIQQGQIRFAPEQADLSATLVCQGLTLRRLAPMLKELGITLQEGGVDVAAQLAATLPLQASSKLGARLQDVAIRHGDEHIELALLDLSGVELDANGATIGSVEITGPSVRVAREPDGTIAVAGIRLHANATPNATASPPPAAVPIASPTTCPFVRVKHVNWHDGNVHFTDSMLPGSPSLAVADLQVTAEELAFGIDQPPGHATATLRLPDNVESLRADLHLQPNANGASGDLRIDATGITAKGLVPWLRDAGLEPTFQSGTFGVAASGQVKVANGAVEASGRIANLRLQDADVVLLSLRNVELQGLRSDAAGLDLGTLRVDEPHVVIEQWPEGRLRMVGMQFGNATSAPAATPTKEVVAVQPANPPSKWRAGTMSIQAAQLTFRDLRTEPHELQLGLDAEIGRQDGDSTPTTFRATLRLEQAIESLALSGELQSAADGLRLRASIDGKGLHGDSLAILLPPNVRSTLSDGSLLAQLTLAMHTRENSTAFDLVVEQVALRDRNEELLAIDRIELHAPSLGTALIHVETLRVDGLRAIAAQTSEGLAVPGMLIKPTANPTTAPVAGPATANTTTRPAIGDSTTYTMPALRIDQLSVGVERLRFRDRVASEPIPLELGLRINLERPWATAPDLTETPPAILSCTVTAAPVCREMHIEARLQPFLLTPTLDLTVRADGIDPTAIARVLPTLGERLGGTTSNATLTAHAHAFLDLRRRNPGRFDFSRPFGAQLLIEDFDLRDASTDTSLAAIPTIDVFARSIDPATGSILLKSVDIDGPTLGATRTKDGLECAGFLFRAAPPTTLPAALPNPTPNTPISAAQRPEFAIDRLRVQGLSFDFRDSVTTPVTHLPVQDFDLDLQHFSTEAFHEPQSFTFQLTMRGGEVELPRRIVRSSVIAGVLGSTATALSGGGDQHELERRPWLQELLLSGQMQVYPQARGTCRFDVSGFEMPAIRGLANLGGVVINDGLLDTNIATTSRGPEGTKVKSNITFTWLSMSEPPSGPISTYLKLPAPLDTVLWVLRNDADEQRIPMQLELPAQGVSSGAVRNAAVESLTLLIGKAIGSAPMRAAGTITDLFGLGGPRNDLQELVTSVPSQPGQVEPDLSVLDRLLASTGNDPEVKFVLSHELGAGDHERMAVLANPRPEVQWAMVARLRERRAELSTARSQLALAARVLYAAGSHDAEAARTRLSTVDTELGEVEATLDQALTVLDGNTRRGRDRNTRRAAIALGNLRLEAVRAAIEARLPPGSADRIELRPARGVTAPGLPAGGQVVVTPRPRPAPDTVKLQRDGTEKTFAGQERQGLYVPPRGLQSMDPVQLRSPGPRAN